MYPQAEAEALRAALQQAAILELGDLGLEATSRRAGAIAGGGAAANGEVRKWNGLADYIASLGPKQKVKAKGWAAALPSLQLSQLSSETPATHFLLCLASSLALPCLSSTRKKLMLPMRGARTLHPRRILHRRVRSGVPPKSAHTCARAQSMLTDSIEPSTVEAMRRLVAFMVGEVNPSKAPEVQVARDSLASLCLWQLVVGYQLRDAEATGKAKELRGR